MLASTPTTSLSVKLWVLIFLFFDTLMIKLHLIYLVAPVCLFTNLWEANNASTHHLTMFIETILNASFIWMGIRRYTSTWTSLVQESFLDSITIVVRNAIAIWMYFRHITVVISSWATEWQNAIFRVPCSIFLMSSSHTLNIFFVAGLKSMPLIYSKIWLITF